jgi:WD40 repeat protein
MLYDLTRGLVVARLPHAVPVRRVAFRSDGRWLAAGLEGRLISVWDLSAAEPQLLQSFAGATTWLAFSSNGEDICAGDEHGVKIRDLRSATEFLPRLGTHGCLGFTPSGANLVVAGRDNAISILAVARKEVLPLLPIVNEQMVHNENGKYIARVIDGNVQLEDASSGAIWRIPDAQAPVALNLDDSLIAACSRATPSVVRLWEINTRRELRQFSGHFCRVTGIDFHPAGSRIATSSPECRACPRCTETGCRDPEDNTGTVKVWDTQTGQELITFPRAGRHLRFVDHGRRIVTWGPESTVQVYDSQSAPYQTAALDR